jgi:hypothetical protein
MTLPDIDSLATAGGVVIDYSPSIDPTTDRPALGTNQGYADATAATHTNIRAFVRFQPVGTGAPILAVSNGHDEVWGGGSGNTVVAPTRTTVGIYVLTWPTTVTDEIAASVLALPGYSGSPHTLNFRHCWGNSEGGATFYNVECAVTAPSVITVWIWSGAAPPALIDTTGVVFGICVI